MASISERYFQQLPLMQALMKEYALLELIKRPCLLFVSLHHRLPGFRQIRMLFLSASRPYLPICWLLFPFRWSRTCMVSGSNPKLEAISVISTVNRDYLTAIAHVIIDDPHVGAGFAYAI